MDRFNLHFYLRLSGFYHVSLSSWHCWRCIYLKTVCDVSVQLQASFYVCRHMIDDYQKPSINSRLGTRWQQYPDAQTGSVT